MTREEMLARSREQFEDSTKKLQQEEEDKKNSFGYFHLLKYAVLQEDGYKLLRFLGTDYPRAVHKVKSSFNPVCFEQALCKDDEGKYRKITGNPEFPNILKKMYLKTKKEGKKDDVTKVMSYTLASINPELFVRIMRNDSDSVQTPGWDFKKSFAFNVLDREQSAWHKKEKQSFLIAKSSSTKENDEGKEITYYQDGLPSSWYEAGYAPKEEGSEAIKETFYFKNSVCEEAGLYFDYDVLVWKTKYTKERGRNLNAITWYKSFKADKKMVEIDKAVQADWDISNLNSPITDEEFNYKLYNLAKLYKPTSAAYIKTHYKELIKKFDEAMGTDFYAELEKQVADEKEAKETQEDNRPKTIFVNFEDQPIQSDIDKEAAEEDDLPKEETKETKSPERDYSGEPFDSAPAKRRTTASTTTGVSVADLEKLGYGFASSLKPEELKSITKVTEEGMEFSFKDVEKCEKCDCKFPLSWTICPACGTKYEQT